MSLDFQGICSRLKKNFGRSRDSFCRVRQIPRRRFDVLAFASGEVGLVPLLLIECKAEEIDENARQQVIGYNDSVRARFIALVGKESEEMGYFDETKRRYLFEPKLPTYRELLSR